LTDEEYEKEKVRITREMPSMRNTKMSADTNTGVLLKILLLAVRSAHSLIEGSGGSLDPSALFDALEDCSISLSKRWLGNFIEKTAGALSKKKNISVWYTDVELYLEQAYKNCLKYGYRPRLLSFEEEMMNQANKVMKEMQSPTSVQKSTGMRREPAAVVCRDFKVASVIFEKREKAIVSVIRQVLERTGKGRDSGVFWMVDAFRVNMDSVGKVEKARDAMLSETDRRLPHNVMTFLARTAPFDFFLMYAYFKESYAFNTVTWYNLDYHTVKAQLEAAHRLNLVPEGHALPTRATTHFYCMKHMKFCSPIVGNDDSPKGHLQTYALGPHRLAIDPVNKSYHCAYGSSSRGTKIKNVSGATLEYVNRISNESLIESAEKSGMSAEELRSVISPEASRAGTAGEEQEPGEDRLEGEHEEDGSSVADQMNILEMTMDDEEGEENEEMEECEKSQEETRGNENKNAFVKAGGKEEKCARKRIDSKERERQNDSKKSKGNDVGASNLPRKKNAANSKKSCIGNEASSIQALGKIIRLGKDTFVLCPYCARMMKFEMYKWTELGLWCGCCIVGQRLLARKYGMTWDEKNQRPTDFAYPRYMGPFPVYWNPVSFSCVVCQGTCTDSRPMEFFLMYNDILERSELENLLDPESKGDWKLNACGLGLLGYYPFCKKHAKPWIGRTPNSMRLSNVIFVFDRIASANISGDKKVEYMLNPAYERNGKSVLFPDCLQLTKLYAKELNERKEIMEKKVFEMHGKEGVEIFRRVVWSGEDICELLSKSSWRVPKRQTKR
jgi:hypothetical protein